MRESVEPRLPIRTERLLLRPLTERDVQALHTYRSDPEVCRFLPFEPMSEAEILTKVQDHWRSQALGPEGSATRLGIEADGLLVGDVVLFVTSRIAQTAELG